MYRTDSVSGVASPTTARQPGKAAPRKASGPTAHPIRGAVKRLGDIVGALLFFSVGLPLYLVIALGVRLSSPGPVHYWQYRVGRGGKRFRFYKFRSMYVDSDDVLSAFLDSDRDAQAQWQTHQKLPNDPRITPFGKLIRRTSLDELPQFWNVLKGDMSVVGPRPCLEHQEEFYGRYWAKYCAVKPGLTGLWQVSGRNRLSYGHRVELDGQYVHEWSLWLDFKILLRTVKAVVSGDGSH